MHAAALKSWRRRPCAWYRNAAELQQNCSHVFFHFCSLTRCVGQILLLLVAIQLCLVAAFAPVVAPSLRAIGKSSLTQVCGDKGKGEKPKKPKQVALSPHSIIPPPYFSCAFSCYCWGVHLRSRNGIAYECALQNSLMNRTSPRSKSQLPLPLQAKSRWQSLQHPRKSKIEKHTSSHSLSLSPARSLSPFLTYAPTQQQRSEFTTWEDPPSLEIKNPIQTVNKHSIHPRFCHSANTLSRICASDLGASSTQF